MYFVLKQNASLPDYQGVDVLRDRVTFQGPDGSHDIPLFVEQYGLTTTAIHRAQIHSKG